MPKEDTRERAGEVGAEMADNMSVKIMQALDGFPNAAPGQRRAMASLIAQSLEGYMLAQDDDDL